MFLLYNQDSYFYKFNRYIWEVTRVYLRCVVIDTFGYCYIYIVANYKICV